MTTTPCLICTVDVSATPSARERGQGKYCSRVCRDAARSTKVVAKCDVCGIIYTHKVSLSQECCSQECAGKLRTLRTRKGTTTTCPACKKDVYSHPSYQRIFCSIACKNAEANKLSTLEKFFAQRTREIRRRSATPSDLSDTTLADLFDTQGGKCHYSGLPMTVGAGKRTLFTMSVDKLIPSKGYTKDNIVLCCFGMNVMKRDHDLNDFETLLAALASKQVPDLKATLPLLKAVGNAGFDIKSIDNAIIPAKGSCVVSTALKLELPDGFYGQIASRSGLAFKHGIEAFGGVIDPSYVGEVKVLLFNRSNTDYTIASGDRVAQILVLPFASPAVKVVSDDELSATLRGDNGFGSSGK